MSQTPQTPQPQFTARQFLVEQILRLHAINSRFQTQPKNIDLVRLATIETPQLFEISLDFTRTLENKVDEIFKDVNATAANTAANVETK